MKKRILQILLSLFLLSLGLIFGSDFLTNINSQEYIFTDIAELPNNQVGLVLGTSKYIADGRRNLFYLYRIEAAKELYDAGKIDSIIVSGDNSTVQYNETDSMKADLIDMGIPEEKIYGDYAGFRTLDSVVRAKEIFGQASYTIVTQEFHLQRAIFLARHEGIEAIGYAAPDVPVGQAPRVWIRERLARVKMMFDIVLGVKPKFGGERMEIGKI